MTYTYESKNDDPNGCPDTVIGECEAICARCGRDMHNELERLRAIEQRARDMRDTSLDLGDWHLAASHILGEDQP